MLRIDAQEFIKGLVQHQGTLAPNRSPPQQVLVDSTLKYLWKWISSAIVFAQPLTSHLRPIKEAAAHPFQTADSTP